MESKCNIKRQRMNKTDVKEFQHCQHRNNNGHTIEYKELVCQRVVGHRLRKCRAAMGKN